jgi:hypothetical protein
LERARAQQRQVRRLDCVRQFVIHDV